VVEARDAHQTLLVQRLGGQTLHYDPATYFVMSIDLPAAGIVRSSPSGAPYLAVSLTLTQPIIVGLLADMPAASAKDEQNKAFSVAAVTTQLLDAWVRMLQLTKSPADIPALAPAFEREILYRVLQGPMGWMLRDIATRIRPSRASTEWFNKSGKSLLDRCAWKSLPRTPR